MCIYIHICFIFFFISRSIFIEDRHKTSIMGRSVLKELTEQEFAQIVKNQTVYNNLRGGGLNDINIFRTQKRYLRGSGLLSTFANLGKLLLPAIRRFVLPAVGSFTSGVVKDVSAGKNFKASVKHRGKKNLKKMGSKILSGKGLKRKRGPVSSGVKRVKNGRKPTSNKKQGHGLKKNKARKTKPKKKANKKRKKYHDIFS